MGVGDVVLTGVEAGTAAGGVPIIAFKSGATMGGNVATTGARVEKDGSSAGGGDSYAHAVSTTGSNMIISSVLYNLNKFSIHSCAHGFVKRCALAHFFGIYITGFHKFYCPVIIGQTGAPAYSHAFMRSDGVGKERGFPGFHAFYQSG